MISCGWNLLADKASLLHKFAIKHKERSGVVGTTRSSFVEAICSINKDLPYSLLLRGLFPK